MKVAIIGTGAMGSVYAALMAAAGNEVWAIDTWAEQVDAIRRDGLRLEGPGGDRRVTGIHATTDTGEVGPCDLVIIATKAAGVAQAARSAQALLGPETPVLLMQNGLGSGEAALEYLPRGRLLAGVAQAFGASMRGPGHAHHNAMQLIRIGELDGGMSARVKRIARLWQDAGFTAQGEDDITRLIWEKFVCNVTFSAPCTVFGRTIGEMMADPESWAVSLGCALEAHAVGEAKGVRFSFEDPVAYVTAFGAKMPAARPSMYLDHLAGRRSEIDFLNGRVPVMAAEVGLAAPFNRTLAAIVRAREAAFD